ncbi:hypothetical protein A2V49_03745 [candidate division WWE3 bacterium RBG_19FT_COMBO_34_6]|uniref:histidine kinase n=1 Tax=candidate division WWE3 bacterium RBG_19FT_COMBO_34_6 TaxID=1802612 RepID=A0A1F4UN19_UNCKA|nr:MAG: hypothetical protein A2V49_03745 [candidate division WWE3 bacterium RBG_19FT_COMBO_34_6]
MENTDIFEAQKRIIDTIAYGIGDAIIIVDNNRNITHFNKQAEEVVGLNIVEVLNKPLTDAFKLHDGVNQIIEDIFCPIGDIDMQGEIFNKKGIKLLTKNDEDKIVNIKTFKVKEGYKINLGCIIFLENVFEQSELERMKLDFVSMAEHVLRTPITIIKGYVSRLLDDKTTAKLDLTEINYINNALLGTSELLALIEDLLNITEIKKGSMIINKTLTNIEGIISKVVGEFRVLAGERGLSIVFIPPVSKLPMVEVDLPKLKVVIQNLIENAIKYSSEGKIEVKILQVENAFQVSVRDNGRGIPQEYIPHLFTKFYRVKKALEMDYGMGLGLFICRQIIEAHHGKIWVDSKEGEGSTFYFEVPFSKPTI